MRGLWLLLLLPVSCLQLSTSASENAGAAGSDGLDASDAAVAVTGADCATDSKSGVTLCTSISLCDDLAVDHEAYPDCGFRIAGTAIDLECLCGDCLCPMGTALSCEQARRLLSDTTELTVCAQLSDDRCAALDTAESAKHESCDRSCANSCVNSPACLELCGC